MSISDISLEVISDSRGEKTLAAHFVFETDGQNKEVSASVPAGKSKGSHEAFALEPEIAIARFSEIKNQILRIASESQTQYDFDGALIDLDASENKKNIGGNLILALSLAFARAKAAEAKLELYEYIRRTAQLPEKKSKAPHPVFNVINGGAHAKNNLDFQEFQVIPATEDFNLAMGVGREYYRKLGKIIEDKFGQAAVSLGDEAGYSAPFKSNEEAIECMADLIIKNSYPLRIGLDVAASHFYKDGFYIVGGKSHNPFEMMEMYEKLISSYNILSIEDPFFEEDFDNFASLLKNISSSSNEKRLVITDDLTTTNPRRLRTAIEKNAGNAILVKLNQIGTLSETLAVVAMAYENEWETIVSHRSGETMDDFIADLAVAVSSWGLKSGAPGKPERVVKYERVMNILS